MVSTSLRRHNPDQVPGVEASSPLSAEFSSAPPVTYYLIANTSDLVCQITTPGQGKRIESRCGKNAPRRRISLSNRLERVLKPFRQSGGFQEKLAVATLRRNQIRSPCPPLQLILNLQFFIQAGRYIV